MWQRSNTERALWPVISIARPSGTQAQTTDQTEESIALALRIAALL
jgi:hypothetical protein